MADHLAVLLPGLNERDRRLALGTEAKSWGRGGIAAVHRATGVSRSTVRRGLNELDSATGEEGPNRRVRAPGGGRKKADIADPELLSCLDSLIEPATRGDPESPLRWTTKSTRHLAAQLTVMGHTISHSAVANLLRSVGYSLRATRKTPEGAQHPSRDTQFRYLNSLAESFLTTGDPVISVDTKMETIPYGVYDTSVFAVTTIKEWWLQIGARVYPISRRLLVTADGGGSNGHPPWLWKHELACLAAATGLEITVCHYPPGTSKWNKKEHRLFSRTTCNWRERPRETYQTIVNLIANTTTGLTVHADLDLYPTKIKITDQQKKSIPITRHGFYGDWNYTIRRSEE